MLVLVGYLVVAGAVFGGYALMGGSFGVLFQPVEVLMIGGAAVGAFIAGNNGKTIRATLQALVGLLRASPHNGQHYMDLLALLYELLAKARKDGMMKLEADVDDPASSEIFQHYPAMLANAELIEFICDYLRLVISGNTETFEVEVRVLKAGVKDPIAVHAGYEHMETLADYYSGNAPDVDVPVNPAKIDRQLTFDKLTNVHYSGTRHPEDQPSHLIVHDTDVCRTRCREEYGNPCTRFCPANVYEMVDAGDGTKKLQINASNCVHCKTCDIMDPYQVITWVPPEGGGGPRYEGM